MKNNNGTIHLNTQQFKIITFYLEGKTTKEIALLMHLSENTIQWYYVGLRIAFNTDKLHNLFAQASIIPFD